MMHGQTRIEFIFGVIIFVAIILYIVNQMNFVFSDMINGYETDTRKAQALDVIKVLVETGSTEEMYLIQSPVDVVLVDDISASMDGKQAPGGGACKKPCDSFPNPSTPANNGCGNFNAVHSSQGENVWTEVWPNCSDCDNITHPGFFRPTVYGTIFDRADINESCPINDVKNTDRLFVEQLNETTDRSALICFDTSAYLRIGLTNNTNTVEYAIDNDIYDAEGNTAIGAGIHSATILLNTTGNTSSKWVEILLTDGQDSPAEPYPTDPISRAQEAAANNITIYTVGYTETRHNLDENQLKQIANITGGKYYYAPNSDQLANYFGDIAYEIKSNTTTTGLLAVRPYNFSIEKIYNLNQNCDNLNIFNLGTYRLKVYNSTDLMLYCGTDTLEPPKVFVSKYVWIGENDKGNITLELW